MTVPDELAPSAARRVADSLLAVALLAGIALPPARFLAEREPDQSALLENRQPAPRPELELDLAALEAFPAAFESWYADAFPFRGALVAWHNAAVLFGLGDAPTSDLVVGRDGWLFLRTNRALDSYRRTYPFPTDELETVAAALFDRHDWCAARDIDFRFVVAPDKHTLYPELLPAWAAPLEPESRLDQLVARMAGTRVAVVDPRERLEAAKEAGLVYYPHGTHWSHLGAFQAYELLCESLSISPWGPEDYDLVVEGAETGDSWADQLLLRGQLVQEVPGLRHKRLVYAPTETWLAPSGQLDGVVENLDPSLPRLVLFRDSFGNWLWPYLAQHFSRLRSESHVEWSADLIRSERPDVVIEERVERHLIVPMPHAPASDEEDLLRSRRWLAARPLPGDGGLAVPGGVGAVMLRLEVDSPTPDMLRVQWTAPGGATRTLTQALPGGHRWIFLELDPTAPGPVSALCEGGTAIEHAALRALED